VIRTFRVILIAAVVGAALGTGWAFHRDAEDEQQRRAFEEAAEDPYAAGAEPPAQTGRVTLAAVEGLPQYPGAFVRPISSGAQLNVAWFATKDSVDQVLSFYEKEFTAKGLIPVSYQFSPVSGYAGYLDFGDHRMHLVSVLRQGDETLVFPSTSYPKKMLEGGASPPAGVPNIAGAEGAVSFDLGGGGSRQVWLATYPGQSLDEVAAAWSRGLAGNGWDVKRADEGGEARLEADRAEGSLQVAIRKDPSAKIAVYVTTAGPRGLP